MTEMLRSVRLTNEAVASIKDIEVQHKVWSSLMKERQMAAELISVYTKAVTMSILADQPFKFLLNSDRTEVVDSFPSDENSKAFLDSLKESQPPNDRT